MNTIKFKDSIHPTDENFNSYLKGKYAYWIQMRYVVPFECLSTADYIKAESSPSSVLTQDRVIYWDIISDSEYNIMSYIDYDATESCNSIAKYVSANEYTTDSDITLEEVKVFRTWLASTLLTLDTDDSGNQLCSMFSEELTHVLEYYAGGMYDDVVKWLIVFGTTEYSLSTSTTTGCGCCGTADLSSLYNTSLTNCDAQAIYQKNIYNAMVSYFGDLDFWTQFDTDFLTDFKQYVDNILSLGLSLSVSEYSSLYTDCGCSSNSNETTLRQILVDLSVALEYLIDGDTSGHKNFCSDAFYNWAVSLYESMIWS